MRPPLQAACHDLYWTVEELGSKIIVDLDEDRGSPLGLGVNALICELEDKAVSPKWLKANMPWLRYIARCAFRLRQGTVHLLNLPQMHRRRQVYTKYVDQCMLGLRDRVTHRPHKKPTAFQGNHPSVLLWQDIACGHHPEEHQVIEG